MKLMSKGSMREPVINLLIKLFKLKPLAKEAIEARVVRKVEEKATRAILRDPTTIKIKVKVTKNNLNPLTREEVSSRAKEERKE